MHSLNIYFSQLWRPGCPRSKYQYIWFLVKIHVLACKQLHSCCVLIWSFLHPGCVIKCSFLGETDTEIDRDRDKRDRASSSSVRFSSVQSLSCVRLSCVRLCDPMNCSTPGLPVHHHLPEPTQTHVHRVRDAIQPSHPRSSPSPPAPNPSQRQSLFQ